PRFFRYIKARPSQVLAARRVAGLKPAGFSSAASSPSIVSVPSATDDDPDLELGPPEPASTLMPTPTSVRFARPKTQQIKLSLVQHFQSLQVGQSQIELNMSRPVGAFDSFDVEKVYAKGTVGWVQIRFRGFVWLNAQGAKTAKPRETQRFMIRSVGSDGWEM